MSWPDSRKEWNLPDLFVVVVVVVDDDDVAVIVFALDDLHWEKRKLVAIVHGN
jgi:hypothetical protein